MIDMNGRPRVLPVTYAIHEAAVWMAIDNKPKRPGRKPARVRWLRERPHAALTVDRYEDDWSALRWVQFIGEIAVLDGPPAGQVSALSPTATRSITRTHRPGRSCGWPSCARSGGEHRDPHPLEECCLIAAGRMFESRRSNLWATDPFRTVGARAAPGATDESLVPPAHLSTWPGLERV